MWEGRIKRGWYIETQIKVSRERVKTIDRYTVCSGSATKEFKTGVFSVYAWVDLTKELLIGVHVNKSWFIILHEEWMILWFFFLIKTGDTRESGEEEVLTRYKITEKIVILGMIFQMTIE